MKKSKKQQTKDILNALKAAKRHEEIDRHGKSIRYASVQKSKKLYCRKAKHKNQDGDKE